MENILSLINQLEVQISDESQLGILHQIQSKIKARAEAEDDFFEADESLTETIDAGIGLICWNSNNLQLQGLMEDLEEALKTTSPLVLSERLKH